MQKLQWFLDKIGQDVMRTSPEGRTTYFEIDTPEVANYAFELQTSGYKYNEIKKVVSFGANVCTACEG